MHQRKRYVGIERLARTCVALDEFHGAVRDLRLHGSAIIQVQFRDLPSYLTFARFINGFGLCDLRVPSLVVADRWPHAFRLVQGWPHRLVVGARDAVPLIKALMRGEPLFGAAKMPFAPHTGGVALRRQQLRDGDLPLRQPVRDAADWDFVGAGTNGEAARHERGSGGCALRLDVEVEQAHAFAASASMLGVGAPRRIPPP